MVEPSDGSWLRIRRSRDRRSGPSSSPYDSARTCRRAGTRRAPHAAALSSTGPASTTPRPARVPARCARVAPTPRSPLRPILWPPRPRRDPPAWPGSAHRGEHRRRRQSRRRGTRRMPGHATALGRRRTVRRPQPARRPAAAPVPPSPTVPPTGVDPLRIDRQPVTTRNGLDDRRAEPSEGPPLPYDMGLNRLWSHWAADHRPTRRPPSRRPTPSVRHDWPTGRADGGDETRRREGSDRRRRRPVARARRRAPRVDVTMCRPSPSSSRRRLPRRPPHVHGTPDRLHLGGTLTVDIVRPASEA